MIPRYISTQISSRFHKGKAIILFGPRQSGKTTLIRRILEESGESYIAYNGDEPDVREMFRSMTSTRLKALLGNRKILFLDEAQKINDIGTTLKLFVDNLPLAQVIATGSSAFELASKTAEPLTGRKYEFFLPPLTFSEIADNAGFLEEKRLLEERLIFGAYPEIVTKPAESAELLQLLAGSYLYKDVLALEAIRNPELIERLLKALALQIGGEVSYLELAQTVGADKGTVEKYLRILEKAYIIFKLPAFSRNLRNELKKAKKFYFYDNGIRNAVMGNLTRIAKRTDIGALWENYIISERIKFLRVRQSNAGVYFWRTVQQQEIDFIEEADGEIYPCEIKWSSKAKAKLPGTFRNNYTAMPLRIVTPANYDEFLTDALRDDSSAARVP